MKVHHKVVETIVSHVMMLQDVIHVLMNISLVKHHVQNVLTTVKSVVMLKHVKHVCQVIWKTEVLVKNVP